MATTLNFIINYKYTFLYILMYIFVFIVCTPPVIITAFFCGLATTINLFTLTGISLFMTKLSISEWRKTQSGLLASLNTLNPGQVVFIFSALGPTFLGWEYTLDSFLSFNYKTILFQIFIMAIITDIGFYIVHYTVHKVSLFRQAHNLHHKCDLKTNQALCTLDENRLEALMRDYIPPVSATLIFPVFHIYTFNIFYLLYTIWAYWLHTGHNQYHLKHHEHYNCNYGVFYITDILMRTYK